MDGFDIQVGRSINAQTIHIPQCLLNLCPVLNTRLVPGCRIANADPAVFATVIGHIQTISEFGLISISAPGRLSQLISGEQSLLNFAKAWHVLDMLRKPTLQEKLLKIYRAHYLKCLKDRVHGEQDPKASESTPLDPDPFVYLRNNVGYHSKAEKFLINFHAGLMRNQKELRRSDFKLLPPEIGALVRDRWLELCGRVRKDSQQSELSYDRIEASDPCYKVTKNEAIQHGDFEIQYVHGGAWGTFGLNPPLPISPRAKRKRPQTTHSTASLGTMPPSAESAESSVLSRQPRLKNPFQTSSPEQKRRKPSSSISPTHLAADHNTVAVGRRQSHNRTSRVSSVSLASDLPSQAPLMSGSPSRGSWSHDIGAVAAMDGESVHDLLPPNLRWNNPPPDGSREFGYLGVLDFAA
jgi:hypothetical protein